MEEFIFYLILTFLFIPILYFLNKKSNTEIKSDENEQLTLRLNKFYLYLGYLSLAIGLFSSVMIFTNENNLILSFSFLLIFGGPGMLLVFSYKNHRIIIYKDKIEVFNLLGNKKTIVWSELRKVDFSFFKGALILIDIKDEKINIHQHIVGFKTIIQKIKNQTTVNVEKIKLPS